MDATTWLLRLKNSLQSLEKDLGGIDALSLGLFVKLAVFKQVGYGANKSLFDTPYYLNDFAS